MARPAFKPAKETGYEWGLYSGGLSYKFYSDTKYVGAIEIDLMFTQKGFNYDLAFESDESYHRRINAIELPLIWQPHFYLFQRHARFFINLGIQVSYNLSSDLQPGIENHGHTRKRQVCHATQP
ncbi:MAG: outer membrane beta-barrel protein [Alistipes indistinctus]